MTKQEATVKIAAKIAIAMAALQEAQTISEESGVEFGFDPAYGMGGTYYPKNHEWHSHDESGWYSSTQSCS